MTLFKARFLCVLAVFCLSSYCFAELRLPTANVVAKRLSPYTYLSSTTIDVTPIKQVSHTISSILQDSPGVQVIPYGSEGHLSLVTIRGSFSHHVLIYLDDILLNNDFGAVDLSLIPLSVIDRITVYRGSQSGAIGGIIKIDTIRSNTSFVSLKSQSFNSHSAQVYQSILDKNVAISWLANTSFSSGNYSFIDTKGTQYNLEDDTQTTRQNNTVNQTVFLTSVATPKHEFKWLIEHLNRGTPGLVTQLAQKASETNHHHYMNWKTNLFSGELNQTISYKTQRFDDLLGEFSGASQTHALTQKTITLQFSDKLLNEGLKYEYLYTLADFDSTQNHIKNSYNFQHQHQVRLDSHHLFSRSDLLFSGGASWLSDTGSMPFGQVGFSFYWLPIFFTKYTFSSGFRAPTFFERFGRIGNHFPNNDLLPEKSLQWSLSNTLLLDNHHLELTVFDFFIHDLIQARLVSSFAIKSFNLESVRIQGIEHSYGYESDTFNYAHSATLQVAKHTLTGKLLPGKSPFVFSQSLSYRFK